MKPRRSVPWLLGAFFLSLLTVYNLYLGLRLVPFSREAARNDKRLLLDRLDMQWAAAGYSSNMLLFNHPIWSSGRSVFSPLVDFRPATGRLDNSRRYKIHDYVVVGRRWGQVSNGQATLATQTSFDRLSTLGEVATAWQGPVSVAIFTPDLEFPLALRYIAYLQSCYRAVRDNVSFHVVYPVEYPPTNFNRLKLELANLTCHDPALSLKQLAKLRPSSMLKWRDRTLYPQNHMRNVARKNCQSMYVFLSDVDIIPRKGLALSLGDFLRRPDVCEPCAFVVPTYEVDEKVILPNNKSDLLQLIRTKKAQPFHKVIFEQNQFATNNSYWESLPEGEAMDAAYKVDNYKFLYEPFYVSKDKVPPHDERFIGYGFSRNTQVYETVFAGYKLWVLNNAFALHRGMITWKTRSTWRLRQSNANYELVDTFKKEVAIRYTQIPTRKA